MSLKRLATDCVRPTTVICLSRRSARQMAALPPCTAIRSSKTHVASSANPIIKLADRLRSELLRRTDRLGVLQRCGRPLGKIRVGREPRVLNAF